MIRYNPKGLSSQEAADSRRAHGDNVITPPKDDSAWKLFVEKFKDPIIRILLLAAVLSLAIGFVHKDFTESIGIICAIILATCVGFWFEWDAMRRFRRLNQVNDDIPVKVMRDGSIREIPRRDVVVGDVVYIESGETVPADGELVEAVSLRINESTLTGELEVDKTVDEAHFDSEATYPSNVALRGTTVADGYGVLVATAVGDATEAGRVTEQATVQSDEQTPLNRQLTRLSKLIGRAGIALAVAIFCVMLGKAVFVGSLFERDWLEISQQVLHIFMVSVAIIVMAVPEGLPMSITLSLAMSMRRMLKTNNLVRRMHACETMGAVTVICTDKTGTLTQNQMQVYESRFFGNPSDEVLEEGIAVNSTAQLDDSEGHVSVLGNPTEGALLLWLRERGVDYRRLRDSARRLEELPFTTERKYMATTVQSATGKRILYVKGAPEIVFGMCSDTAGVTKAEIDAQLLEYQNMAMRTLGFAYAELADGQSLETLNSQPSTLNLRFLGIVAISDPVRADVPEAVREVVDAGVKIKIVTGDTPGTAKEIGRQIGLWHDHEDGDDSIITGPEFARLSDEELKERVGGLKIIARARPLDKKRLVEALQANGEVVAVTGDGTNDAPALKTAHVGLSMGDGTSVAKEASDITIINNSFSSIGRAVMWGRSLYQNIQRFLLFQLTVNVAACFLVLIGSFIGNESPLTVTQMLWVNLIMDTFGAMALASLPPAPDMMREKPRDRRAFILTRTMMAELLGVGIIFFAITLGFYCIFNAMDVTSMVQLFHAPAKAAPGMTAYEATLLFSIFVWTHFWYMFCTRCFETGKSIFSLKMSQGFWSIVAIIVIGQLFITEIAYDFFNCAPMLHTADWHWNGSGALDFVIIVGASSLVLWIRELYRLILPSGR